MPCSVIEQYDSQMGFERVFYFSCRNYLYPLIGKQSVTTKANKLLPKHWFYLAIGYHLSARLQLNSKAEVIKLNDYSLSRSLLDDVSETLKVRCYTTEQVKNIEGRGFMSREELRAAEVTWTGTCSISLNRFLFGKDESKGVLVHQAPTRNKSGSPETVDWYIANSRNGMLLSPVG